MPLDLFQTQQNGDEMSFTSGCRALIPGWDLHACVTKCSVVSSTIVDCHHKHGSCKRGKEKRGREGKGREAAAAATSAAKEGKRDERKGDDPLGEYLSFCNH